MGMIVNNDKTKVMIVKSQNITYDTLVYDKDRLEEVPSYTYLGIDINHKINWNYRVEKWINGGWKSYYELGNKCKLEDLWLCVIFQI
jgi:hypothetical protein